MKSDLDELADLFFGMEVNGKLEGVLLRSDFDKNKFGCKSLSRDQYKNLISKNCFYCDKSSCGGVDRKNSNLGHIIRNCIPCCEKCNNILGDLPYKAKIELKSGLYNINKKGLLKKWEIPTKRKKK